MRCPRCDRVVQELAFSQTLGTQCCERCGALPTRAGRRRPAPRPAPPPQGPYEALWARVWRRLTETTRMPIFLIARAQIAAYCPVCVDGCVAVMFIDAPSGPQIRIGCSDGWTGRCSAGCDGEEIAERLLYE